MRIELVAFYSNDGRSFKPGERYTVDGERYSEKVACSCAGSGFKMKWFYNVTIGGKQYRIQEEFAVVVDESAALPAKESISDRLAGIGNEPDERYEERRPDNYHPAAEAKRFDDLAKVDWRQGK